MSDNNDGWEGDDDLGDLLVDEDDNNNNNDRVPAVDASAARNTTSDGWDDDEIDIDVDSDLDQNNSKNPKNDSPFPIVTTHLVQRDMKIDDDDDDDNNNKNSPMDGWNDSDDALLNLSESMDDHATEATTTGQSVVGSLSTNTGSHLNRSFPPTTATATNPGISSQKREMIASELESYLKQLHDAHWLLQSIRAVLEAEYHTVSKAIELQQYYASRPALHEYTLDKELPRMSYSLINGRGHVVTQQKQQIAQQLTILHEQALQFQQHDPSAPPFLLSRCANQSILADLLHVLTGPDRLIRPHFAAVGVASSCHFDLHIENPQRIQVQATLDVSLPSSGRDTTRWKVAEIPVHVFFACGGGSDMDEGDHQPLLNYSVAPVRSMQNETDPAVWQEQLENTIHILCDLDLDLVDQEQAAADAAYSAPSFRDQFLQQSQLWTDSLRSAWQDVNAITGITRKLNQIPSFLPQDVLEAAAAEQEMHSMIASNVTPGPPVSALLQTRQQPQPPLQHGVNQPTQQQRPTSILGGLVRTGWSTLAKTVALPEEDPSIYQGWSPPPPASSVDATDKLDGRGGRVAATGSGPRLYHKDTPPPPPPLAAEPRQIDAERGPPAATAKAGMPVALATSAPELATAGMPTNQAPHYPHSPLPKPEHAKSNQTVRPVTAPPASPLLPTSPHQDHRMGQNQSNMPFPMLHKISNLDEGIKQPLGGRITPVVDDSVNAEWKPKAGFIASPAVPESAQSITIRSEAASTLMTNKRATDRSEVVQSSLSTIGPDRSAGNKSASAFFTGSDETRDPPQIPRMGLPPTVTAPASAGAAVVLSCELLCDRGATHDVLMDYDSDTDVIQTRQRWQHPRPMSRQLPP